MGKHQVRQYEIRQQLHFVVRSTPDILLFSCLLFSCENFDLWGCKFQQLTTIVAWQEGSIPIPWFLRRKRQILLGSNHLEPQHSPTFLGRNGSIWYNPIKKCSPYDSRLVILIFHDFSRLAKKKGKPQKDCKKACRISFRILKNWSEPPHQWPSASSLARHADTWQGELVILSVDGWNPATPVEVSSLS